MKIKQNPTAVKAKESSFQSLVFDILTAILAGLIVGTAYFFFQNSNGFAPGGVGGLATMTFHFLQAGGSNFPWAVLMLLFNIPIFILVTILVNRKLGLILILYMSVQSFSAELLERIGAKPYSLINYGGDFEIVFACLATGIISGIGFSLMLRRFGASGGTYAISALIKKARPAANIPYVAFLMDASVVFISFIDYDFRITPVICTLLNLFVANVVVDYALSGVKNGYRFDIVTTAPEEMAAELMQKLGHGVTRVQVMGMYSHTDKYLLICIIRKKQIGDMMKIIKSYPGSFACFEKVNEVFGRFKR